MFDATLNIVRIDAVKAEDHIRLIQVLGIMIPVAQDQVMPIPGGQIQTPINKEMATSLGNTLLELAAELPDPRPTVQTASSMAEAENMARQDASIQKLREGR